MLGIIDQCTFLIHFLSKEQLPSLLFIYVFPGPSRFLASKTRGVYSLELSGTSCLVPMLLLLGNGIVSWNGGQGD